MEQYFGKSYILRAWQTYRSLGTHMKRVRSQDLNPVHRFVQIRVVDGRFRGIYVFSEFRRLVQDLGTFRAIFSCFGCVARTVGAGRGTSILIPYDS